MKTHIPDGTIPGYTPNKWTFYSVCGYFKTSDWTTRRIYNAEWYRTQQEIPTCKLCREYLYFGVIGGHP